MKIKIKNNQLIPLINLIYTIKSKGKKARAVARLSSSVHEVYETYKEDQYRIVEDREGVVGENGVIDCSDEEVRILINKELDELHNEEVSIDISRAENLIGELLEALNEDIEDLGGEDLCLYDEVVSQIERLKE